MKILFFLSAIVLLNTPTTVMAKNSAYTSEEYNCWQQNDKSYCVDNKNRPLTGRIEVKDSSTEAIIFSRYKNGYLSGLTTEYDKEGHMLRKTYYKDGKKSSSERLYHKNRTISQVAEYKNGKLDGNAEQYNEKGKLLGKFKYQNGKFIKGYCIQYQNGHKNKISINAQMVENNKLYTCEE